MKNILVVIFSIVIFCSCSTEQNVNEPVVVSKPPLNLKYDVVVYGGTSAGIIAAEQAVNMGKSVILICNSKRVGGMTTNGLGNTDVGKSSVVGGLALDFYKRVGANYNIKGAKWTFEPNVALKVFNDIIREKKITVVYDERLLLGSGVAKNADGFIEKITMESGKVYQGSFFIDATYEGDLMANSGVSYIVGRESNSTYGETKNGVTGISDVNIVDPYITMGKPHSGILPRLTHIKNIPAMGSGDDNVMPYNFRLCLTNVPENRVLIEKPVEYDPMEYELLIRSIANDPSLPNWTMIPIPGNKYDMNNWGAFSSDYSGMNKLYPDGNYSVREGIKKQHEIYLKGLLWTLQNEERIPASYRSKYIGYGLAKDEFIDNNNWPLEMYVREARRMIGEYVMTELSITNKDVEDAVCLGSYPMDSHIVQLVFIPNKRVNFEGSLFIAVNEPYGISYKSILPKATECNNLLVPVCLSSSHVAFSSIRMEPQFMMLAQAAATAACIAINNGTADIHDVKFSDLQTKLLFDGQVLK
ncbi:FAD-dependent oxidoreductase [Flavobacterium sp. 2]|uniref:FAD-dependent oxidoreductase n=1 Tax=Flavobacterium sp. 2 TaxID=308053 RepID=UPI003CF66904